MQFSFGLCSVPFRSRLGPKSGSSRFSQAIAARPDIGHRPTAVEIADMAYMGGKPSWIKVNGIIFEKYRYSVVEPAEDLPARSSEWHEEPGTGAYGSWVTLPGDSSNMNEPQPRGARAPHCPAWQEKDRTWIPQHTMVTVRDTQRRYRDAGGRGYRTLSFHCWLCAAIVEGDSWHCPAHQVDICQKCQGPFGRRHVPTLFYEERYIHERAEFRNLTLDVDWRTGIHLLQNIPRTCLGKPEEVSLHVRDRAIEIQIEDCRRRAAEDAAKKEKAWTKTSEEEHDTMARIEGAYRPSDRTEDWNLPYYLRGLRPQNPKIPLWGWFDQMPASYRSELGRLFHYNRTDEQDFTREDWFTALGYAVNQLLRWGKRGGFDHKPTDWVEWGHRAQVLW